MRCRFVSMIPQFLTPLFEAFVADLWKNRPPSLACAMTVVHHFFLAGTFSRRDLPFSLPFVGIDACSHPVDSLTSTPLHFHVLCLRMAEDVLEIHLFLIVVGDDERPYLLPRASLPFP